MNKAKQLVDDYYKVVVALEDYREAVLPVGTRVRVGKAAAVVALHHQCIEYVIVKNAGGFMTALIDECVVVKKKGAK